MGHLPQRDFSEILIGKIAGGLNDSVRISPIEANSFSGIQGGRSSAKQIPRNLMLPNDQIWTIKELLMAVASLTQSTHLGETTRFSETEIPEA